MNSLIIIGSLTLIISFVLTRWLSKKNIIIDTPNDRSSHVTPVPRSGGVAVYLSCLISCILFYTFTPAHPHPTLIYLGLILSGLFLFSFLDDVRSINPKLKLLVHLCFAWLISTVLGPITALHLPGIIIPFHSLSIPLTMCYILGFINMYNFMDGMDGYATSQGIIGLAALVIVFNITFSISPILILIICALFGFLAHNKPKASIFLGDSGSTTLGALFGSLPLLLYPSSPESVVVNLLLFGVFFSDTVTTIIKRAAAKKPLLEAHREHYYQLLMRSGYSHQSTLLAEIPLMILCAFIAICYTLVQPPYQLGLVAILLLVIGAKFYRITTMFNKAQKNHDNSL